jgi:hypothetical protein
MTRAFIRENIGALPIALLFAMTYSLGSAYANNGNSPFGWQTLIVMTGFAFLFFLPLLVFSRWIIFATAKTSALDGSSHPLVPSWQKRNVLSGTCLILCLWLPWLISLYPGIMSGDTTIQISYFYSGEFSADNPLFDTLLFGAFVLPSAEIFGTHNYGAYLYVILQSIAMAFSFSLSCGYMERLHTPRSFRVVTLLFFALLPVFPIYATTIVKDALFSWLYVLYIIAIIELVRSKGDVLSNKRYRACLIALCILLALTKRTGIYVVILTGLILLFLFRKQWKRLVLPLVLPLMIIYGVFPIALYPVFDAKETKTYDAYSVLFQQTARYAVFFGDETTPGQKEAIDKILGYKTLAERYVWYSADDVKSGFKADVTSEDMTNYIKVWAEQGLRHPVVYLEALIGTTYPYFAPADSFQTYISYVPASEEGDYLDVPKSLVSIHNNLSRVVSWLNNESATKILNSLTLYVWWIPLFSFWLVKAHKNRLSWVFVPILISFLILLVSPGALGNDRYALPMLYTAPLLIALIFEAIHSKAHSADADNTRVESI